MDAILANVFLKVQERLASLAGLKFVDQDMGQLEFDEGERSPVAFPCALFDMVDIRYTDNLRKSQLSEAVLEVRLAVNAYTAATHYYKQEHKEKAISYFNLEHNVVMLLHGWSDDHYFNPLSRISAQTEKRQDNVRVRILRFAFGFSDNTAMDVYTPIERPDMELNVQK